ncbi:MAG: GyrI-like domain-containing protein, partial [Burkholderiales bacterium]|nr:GyrI-like domain-containing protein [Burkholderiales bacterium]
CEHEQIVRAEIPAGSCARLRIVGSDDGLEQAIRFLYAEWLPHSGKAVRDFPLFLQRINFFPDVPENELITDIYLPLVLQ